MNTITKQRLRLPNLFDNFFNDYHTESYDNHIAIPSANVKNEDNHFLIELAVPGLKKQDIEINIDDDLLTVSSVHQEVKEEKEGDNYTFKEFSYGAFKRTFRLPKYVLKDKIVAKYEGGVLLVTVPKEKNEGKLLKKIEIA